MSFVFEISRNPQLEGATITQQAHKNNICLPAAAQSATEGVMRLLLLLPASAAARITRLAPSAATAAAGGRSGCVFHAGPAAAAVATVCLGSTIFFYFHFLCLI